MAGGEDRQAILTTLTTEHHTFHRVRSQTVSESDTTGLGRVRIANA
jgi:hypothetical protein